MAAALVAALLILPGVASAQSPSSDPQSGSPPGVIYELPLESGRDDAAPRGRSGGERRSQRRGGGGSGGASGGSSGGGSGSSAARSGSGGSGSFADAGQGGSVEGSGTFAGGNGNDGLRGDDRDGEGSSGDSPLRSENGFGSSSEVPGLDERGTLSATDTAESASGLGTGRLVAIALLAAVVLAGVALGVARQARSRD